MPNVAKSFTVGLVLSAVAAPGVSRADDVSPLWSGAYLGIHAGYGKGDREMTVPAAFAQDRPTPDRSGWLGGVLAGYNYHVGIFVMGVEVDGSWSNIMPRMTFPALVGTDAIHTYSTFDYLATARVRLGLAAGPWLFYGTGGGAWMHSSSDITLTNGVGPNWGPILARGESSADHLGWVAGLGLEYAVSNHWIAHIEYLHYDFGTETYTYSTLGTVTSAAATIESARMAIAYKF